MSYSDRGPFHNLRCLCRSPQGKGERRLLAERTAVDLAQGYCVTEVELCAGAPPVSSMFDAIHIDVYMPINISNFAAEYGPEEYGGKYKPLDILIILGRQPDPQLDDFASISHNTLQDTLAINANGPLLLIQALTPNLAAASHPRIGLMSQSQLHRSISGGMYSYRAADAALKCFATTMAHDLRDKNIFVAMLQMGDMMGDVIEGSGRYRLPSAPDSVERDKRVWKMAEQMMQVLCIESKFDTGKYWNRDGQQLDNRRHAIVHSTRRLTKWGAGQVEEGIPLNMWRADPVDEAVSEGERGKSPCDCIEDVATKKRKAEELE